jgi:metacaspase-1
MKRLLLLLFICLGISALAQRKIGLIVAIGEYPAGGGWRSLSSINDIRYVKAGLIQNGFAEKDIDTLINSQATKNGILKALDDLISRSQPGDIVVFHFSGHGQQIYDDNNDEMDGYDEALIPYDAAAQYDPVSYRGQKHLRDDELGEKLNAIRAKIGAAGSLVVIVDACHSGTATRGREFAARGKAEAFTIPGFKPNVKINFASNADAENSFLGNVKTGNMIVFSASSPNQVNFETKDYLNKGVGSLSYAFARALTDLKAHSTYGYLFEKIRAQIQAKFPQQVPMVEGALNQEVFGGNFIAPESYIALQRWLNDTTFAINEGFLNNVNKGSRFRIYALNDKDETMPLAEGRIIIAGSFQSIGVLTKSILKGEAYKVKMDEENFGEFTASLFFKTSDEKAKQPSMLISQLKNYIKPYQFLSVSATPDHIFEVQATRSGDAAINLIDNQDSTRWSTMVKKGDTLSQEALKSMLSNLKKAMRVNYLRSMADGGSLANNILIEIIPEVKTNIENGQISLKSGDVFTIRIVNKNSYEVYFNLVDLTPDNAVKVLVPEDGKTAADYAVPAEDELVIRDVSVDEGTPAGREFMKFIFTKNPVDLRPVFARSATRGTKSNTGLEGLIDDVFKDGDNEVSTRGFSVSNVKLDEIGVLTKSFNIKK